MPLVFRREKKFALLCAVNPPLCRLELRLKTLHKYITGQVLAALLLTLAVFTGVLLVGNALREILTLLSSSHVPPLLLLRTILYLIPFVWVFALPMAMLTATLLVFGRFSADQELTAARASGVSLLSLVTPVLVLSLLCCGLSAWFSLDLGPRSRAKFKDLTNVLRSVAMNAQIPAGRFIRDFPGYIFYVEKNRDGALENVMIYRLQNETNVDATIHAEGGHLHPDRAQNQLVLALTDARMVVVGPHGNAINASPTLSLNLSLNAVTNRVSKPKIDDMTFRQLQQEMHDLEQLKFTAADSHAPADQAGLQRLELSVGTNSSPAEMAAILRKAEQLRGQEINRVRVSMHREVAFSFACFGFALVGIPLGIRVHRRETNIGIFIALALVVVYYGFVMLGNSLAAHPEFYPHLILWVPNFIFQIVGAGLLWRANRGI
jgi:lipopolysaccharide export system permease protein